MSLTRPIPPQCGWIVQELRLHVPRPETPSARDPDGRALRWKVGTTCALGLLPGAASPAPTSARLCGWPQHADASPADREVHMFWRWWDEQSDPQAAVDAVWGEA